jgi:nucleotidyltransferase/DNA polymerase involved in DNA repair
MPYRSPEQTLIACVWMPRFEIQVERRRYPDLGALPLALLSLGVQPAVVALSREAQAAGLRKAMPFREVMAIAPHTVCRTEDPHFYQVAFSQVLLDLEAVSPLIEPGLGGDVGVAFLNMEGLMAGDCYGDLREPLPGAYGRFRHPYTLMAALERAVRPPWAARIGIGEGKFVAWAAARANLQNVDPATFFLSRSGRSCWIRAARVKDFLRPIPMDALPVEEAMKRKLWGFGLRTLGQLADLPASAVAAQFGKNGRRAWLLAGGKDDNPLRPREAPREVAETIRFPDPEESIAAFLAAVRELLDRLLQRPEVQGRGVRQARVDAVLESRHTWSQTVTFKQPGSRVETLFPPLRFCLERVHPTEAVEEVSLVFTAFMASQPGGQMSLFPEPGQQRRSRVAESLRQLAVQMGRAPISRVVEVEPWSRIPERRYHLLNCDP